MQGIMLMNGLAAPAAPGQNGGAQAPPDGAAGLFQAILQSIRGEGPSGAAAQMPDLSMLLTPRRGQAVEAISVQAGLIVPQLVPPVTPDGAPMIDVPVPPLDPATADEADAATPIEGLTALLGPLMLMVEQVPVAGESVGTQAAVTEGAAPTVVSGVSQQETAEPAAPVPQGEIPAEAVPEGKRFADVLRMAAQVDDGFAKPDHSATQQGPTQQSTIQQSKPRNFAQDFRPVEAPAHAHTNEPPSALVANHSAPIPEVEAQPVQTVGTPHRPDATVESLPLEPTAVLVADAEPTGADGTDRTDLSMPRTSTEPSITESKAGTDQVAPQRSVDPEPILRQVTRFVKVMQDGHRSEMYLKLHPAELGAITVRVVVTEGLVQAQLTAHEPAVKAALEANLEQLKNRFAEQGMQVESIHVAVGSDGGFGPFQQSRHSQQGQGHGRPQGHAPAMAEQALEHDTTAEARRQSPTNGRAGRRIDAWA